MVHRDAQRHLVLLAQALLFFLLDIADFPENDLWVINPQQSQYPKDIAYSERYREMGKQY